MDDNSLKDAGNWDFEKPIPYERTGASRRAIVSVPFKPAEFQRVTQGAERAGEKVSVFVRRAALEKADAVIGMWVHGLTYSNFDNSSDVMLLTVGEAPAVPPSDSEKAGRDFEAVYLPS